MSNIIPFVSSSPPPLDEDQAFGWDDDDDDDFGNFASAPSAGGDDTSGGGSFVADWPVSDVSTGSSKEPSPENDQPNAVKDVSADESFSKHGVVHNKEEVGSDDVGDDDDFADFATFQGDGSRTGKPHIDSLPLKTTHQPKVDCDTDSDMGVGKGTDTVSVMEKSRESTATDSGLFSTDMSPLPQSESLCISEGDKTLHSDDETFSDMPQDSQPQVSPHNDLNQIPAHADCGQDEDSLSQCEDSEVSYDKEPSRQSDTTLSPDQTDQCQPAAFGAAENEIVENGEISSFDNQDSTDGSLCQNERSGSVSPVPSSVSVEGHDQPENASFVEKDQQEQSSVPDIENGISERIAEPEGSAAGSSNATEDAEDTPPSNIDLPDSVTQSSDEGCVSKFPGECNEDEDEDDDWAAFETSPSPTLVDHDAKDKPDEPEDLVLRKDSIHFDDEEDASGASLEDAVVSENEKLAEEGKTESAMDKDAEGDKDIPEEDIPEDLSDTHCKDGVPREGDCQPGHPVDYTSSKQSSHISSTSLADDKQTSLGREDDDSLTEDDGFGDFRGETAPTQTVLPSEDSTAGNEDFAEFSSVEPSQGNAEEEDFGGFSSTQAAGGEEDDDDDFGDFNAGSLSSGAAAPNTDKDDFGAFSNKSGDTAGGGDDFGDFSGQPAASSDSGWADFGEPPKPSSADDDDDDDDFGNFSTSEKPTAPASFSDGKPSSVTDTRFTSSEATSSSSEDVKQKRVETALKSCFPPCGETQQEPSDENGGEEEVEVDVSSCDKKTLGMLETILSYGLQFRSASQQTWQVVQHPSRKDPRVKLWGQLQDVDGSPAVVYQWGKSNTNSHLFHTLHIDTQNMLIGHKKRSVPIFATGLSLLEPIRGGRKEREAGGSSQPDQSAVSSVLSPSLVESSSQETERRTQEIPAVDFDWSTSGLTNPLTSHSLDLDFLVGQDSQASDKPSVFQSELLDAPRSSVKSSQPLEDILKSVKPTSVRSRRDDAAASSQMSAEALRVLASLPDLTFMQSKVLMFPIKN
ncbi:uncharacterized protein LOC143281578 isoform X2 [Babylonia areolata]|uniref:uncharacterized protein LOC143281578 isoform X2 n=1 Tax=Babylonia areolata TaxID=304850 RepID=UPI003FD62523